MIRFRARSSAARHAAVWLFAGALAGVATAAETSAQTPAGQAPTTGVSLAGRNVYSAGAQVRTPAAVEGDLIAVGGRVIVEHPVKGDATLAGGSVDVRAPVGDDLRAAGGDVSVEAAVGGELMASAGNFTLTKGGRVNQGAWVYAGRITVDGRIDGTLKAGAQKIVINGEIAGDVRLKAEQIELGPNARIAGALSYTSPGEIQKAEGATIAGALTRLADLEDNKAGHMVHERRLGAGSSWPGVALTFVSLLAFAAVFLLVFPKFATHASETVKASPWLSLGLGFGALVTLPVLAVLLFVTLLGIPLGIAVLALYPVLLLTGYVVGVLFIASLAQKAVRQDTPTSFALQIGFFALALLLIMLLSRLPFVGVMALAALTVAGIGACVLELHRRRRAGERLSPSAPGPVS